MTVKCKYGKTQVYVLNIRYLHDINQEIL